MLLNIVLGFIRFNYYVYSNSKSCKKNDTDQNMTTKDLKKLESILWSSADNLRANSDLSSNEYSVPVLGLIFLKFADNHYSKYEPEIIAEYEKRKGKRVQKELHEIAIEICGLYLTKEARYDYLLNLPGDKDFAAAIKKAMIAIEKYKPELAGVLPKDEYFKLTRKPENKDLPMDLLKNFSNIPKDASGDVLGQVYEYFLGNFALAEGQGGGEFFTPRSVVRLMVEMIEPHNGTVYDPACGSGGMFVQSVRFIEEHNKERLNGNVKDVYVYGQEKRNETIKLAKMNLAVNNLRGEIKQAISYYEDHFDSFEKFDYVLANPPFNVDDVNLKRIESDKRFNTYGIPRNKSKVKKKDAVKETVPNANYLWINLFATSLKKKSGRAALVMANSASDARHSEADIRKTLIENNLIYGMLTLPSNMFYTVTLPATLWFFDKGKTDNKILFIDARNVFTTIDRAHREFSDEQIQNLALISRLNRGNRDQFVELVHNYFEQSFTELEPLKNSLQNNHDLFKKFIDEFNQWYSHCESRLRDEVISIGNSESLSKVAEKSVIYSVGDGYQPSSLDLDFKSQLNELKTINISDELKSIDDLTNFYIEYKKKLNLTRIDFTNLKQRELKEQFRNVTETLTHTYKSFDKLLHKIETLYQYADKELKEKNDKIWKEITNLKELRTALAELHDRLNPNYLRDSNFLEKSFVYFLKNIEWLQERFPDAKYEDVTGLCKLASIEEIKEQDYSLNPGRYVGVVIEEDGKTEEEFMGELKNLQAELNSLNENTLTLEKIIKTNINKLIMTEE